MEYPQPHLHLRRIRQLEGLRQIDVAQRLNCGQPTLAGFETGARGYTLAQLVAWAAIFDLDVQISLVPKNRNE